MNEIIEEPPNCPVCSKYMKISCEGVCLVCAKGISETYVMLTEILD